jgi:hypothetical protein
MRALGIDATPMSLRTGCCGPEKVARDKEQHVEL